MSAVGAALVPSLCCLLLKTTALLLAAGAANLLLWRASAAARNMIWSAAIGSVLVLPILSLSVPHWDIPWRMEDATASPQAARPGAVTVVVIDQDTPVAAVVQAPAPGVLSRLHFSSLSAAQVGIAVWLIGCVVAALQITAALFRLGRARRRSRIVDAATLSIADSAQRRLGLRRWVNLRRAEERCELIVPATWGLVHPVILLPNRSAEWSEECVRAALLHELAHVRRWDWARQTAASVVCAAF